MTARRVSNNKRGGSRWEVKAYLLFEEEELDSSEMMGDSTTQSPPAGGSGGGEANASSTEEVAPQLSPEELEQKRILELEKHYHRRRCIAQEIIQTERTYVGHLSDIVELYLRPMEQGIKAGLERSPPAKIGKEIPSEADFKVLFVFILDIYDLNKKFLGTIEQMVPHIEQQHHDELQMGGAFEDVTASFKLYSAFVNSYDKSLDALGRVEATRLWAEIMKKVDNLVRDERPLTFETLLVTPIQRIPRYLLLLKDMLRHTPAEHPDYEKLSIVLPKMEEVANWINNEKSKFDNLTIIQTLSDTISGYEDSFLKLGRRFLREGLLSQYINDSMRSKQRYLFLFSDIILLTQPRRGSAMPLLKKAAPKYQFMASVELERCKVFGPAEVSVPGAKHALKLLLADGSSWILHNSSERDVTSWYQSLKEAIDEAQASMISKHQARATRLPQLRMSLTEGDEDEDEVVGGVSKYHTHRTTTVTEPGQRARSATGSVELPPMAQSPAALRGGSIPPTPTLPPPLDLPSLSSTLGHQLPRPQLLPFALPVSPQRPNRHRLQPVSLSSDNVDTAPSGQSSTLSYSSTSFSSLSSSKKLYRRTLSELLASQISDSQRQQHQQPQQHHQQQQSHAGTFSQSGGRHTNSNNNHSPHNNNNHHNNNQSPNSNSPNGEAKRMGMSGEIAVLGSGERRNSSSIPAELKEGIKRGLAKQQSMSTPSSPVPTHLSSSSPTAPFLSPARRSRSSGRDDEAESGSPGKWPAPRRTVGPPTPEGGGLVSRREMARMLEVSLNLNKDLKKRVCQSPGKKELDRST